VTVILLVCHGGKLRNDEYPVQVIGKDRTIRSRVVPSNHSIQDSPSSSTVELGVTALNCQQGLASCERVTYVNVPDTPVNIVRSRTISEFRGVTTDNLVPLLLLKEPDGARKETCGNKVKEAS
jgi:hypothetical protein